MNERISSAISTIIVIAGLIYLVYYISPVCPSRETIKKSMQIIENEIDKEYNKIKK
jgi:hypothetical protein